MVHAPCAPIKERLNALSTKIINSNELQRAHDPSLSEVKVAHKPSCLRLRTDRAHPSRRTFSTMRDREHETDNTSFISNTSTYVTSTTLERTLQNQNIKSWMYWARWEKRKPKKKSFGSGFFRSRSVPSALSSEGDRGSLLESISDTACIRPSSLSTRSSLSSRCSLPSTSQLNRIGYVKCYTKVYAVLRREFLLLYRGDCAPRFSSIAKEPLVQIAITNVVRLNEIAGTVFFVRDPHQEEMELHLYDRGNIELANDWEDALEEASAITNKHLSNFSIDIDELPRHSLYRGTLYDLRLQRMSFCQTLQEKVKLYAKTKSGLLLSRRSITTDLS
uniref:Uncharacterized protein AlNc14C194G8525 n=1 Tax=Albugo laibachii Nc14 TaxID=890382 RepID=F0WQ45_9STRA|nr:conserved hypothetical protein [Albugo laibachii Nc14]|eukprot:CCA23450.1 conserved hypothetical protein [Albugo laibachii Nc14]